jgi:hypothetical protein
MAGILKNELILLWPKRTNNPELDRVIALRTVIERRRCGFQP